MARQLLLLAVALINLLLSSLVSAGDLSGTGPPIGFGACFTTSLHPDSTLAIRVSAVGRVDSIVVARVSVRLPDSWILIVGDTARTFHPNLKEGFWMLQFRAPTSGEYEIRGALTADLGAEGVYESEFSLPASIGSNVRIGGVSQIIRRELIRNGQRYRYGNSRLIPIEHRTYIAASDIATAPQITEQSTAVCSGCDMASSESVRLHVLVSDDGTVISAEHDAGGLARYAGGVVDAAKQEVLKWKFRPATAGLTPVSQWTVVNVLVVPAAVKPD